jgi:hypothetical protein
LERIQIDPSSQQEMGFLHIDPNVGPFDTELRQNLDQESINQFLVRFLTVIEVTEEQYLLLLRIHHYIFVMSNNWELDYYSQIKNSPVKHSILQEWLTAGYQISSENPQPRHSLLTFLKSKSSEENDYQVDWDLIHEFNIYIEEISNYYCFLNNLEDGVEPPPTHKNTLIVESLRHFKTRYVDMKWDKKYILQSISKTEKMQKFLMCHSVKVEKSEGEQKQKLNFLSRKLFIKNSYKIYTNETDYMVSCKGLRKCT